jgi:hypothetical protein
MADGKVETDILETVINEIHNEAIREPLTDLFTTCGKKGNTKY